MHSLGWKIPYDKPDLIKLPIWLAPQVEHSQNPGALECIVWPLLSGLHFLVKRVLSGKEGPNRETWHYPMPLVELQAGFAGKS